MIDADGIHAKLECVNPSGSVKDRIAKYILEESEKRGLLRPGMTIIEATSGNTGISLSYYARLKGYPIIIVMPEDMTEERKALIRSLGADLRLCAPGDFSMAAGIRDRLAAEQGYFNPDQFSNPLNVECHWKTTGPEILREVSGPIDAFVAGVGTGGTLIGAGTALRERYPGVRIVAVEPAESAVLSGRPPGRHGINGIGDGFIPPIAGDGRGGIHPMIDEVITVSTEEAKRAALRIREKYGCCVGLSSGANFIAAEKLRERFETVVTVFADGYAKYQSQGLGPCQPGGCPYEDPDSLTRRAGKA